MAFIRHTHIQTLQTVYSFSLKSSLMQLTNAVLHLKLTLSSVTKRKYYVSFSLFFKWKLRSSIPTLLLSNDIWSPPWYKNMLPPPQPPTCPHTHTLTQNVTRPRRNDQHAHLALPHSKGRYSLAVMLYAAHTHIHTHTRAQIIKEQPTQWLDIHWRKAYPMILEKSWIRAFKTPHMHFIYAVGLMKEKVDIINVRYAVVLVRPVLTCWLAGWLVGYIPR